MNEGQRWDEWLRTDGVPSTPSLRGGRCPRVAAQESIAADGEPFFSIRSA